MLRRFSGKSFSLFGFSLAVCSVMAAGLNAGTIEYNRDIRPILQDNCFSCHGPDSASRKADLRLDRRDAAMEAGAFIPGKSDESEIVKRILSDDPELVMPTPASHKKLSAAQKELLKNWIQTGGEYQQHWSFIEPKLPVLPEVRNAGWAKSPLDRFVLAKLESAGLEPASEADIRTLVRRVCLDLTGLPPTPEEVEAVVADPMPDRYERYVDSLLDRKSWGEHRGRYWLDYARFADSHGIHFDNYREMYSFREWVINAFNQNMPFNQFTVEQLAGDLLPNATIEQKIASGFNRCNITTSEGGAINEEYLVLYARDRVETTAAVWMGLTAGCAVCHDHKFDPISQREFYELSAFFNNTTQNAMDGNRRDTPPIIHVPKPEDRERYEQLPELISKAQMARDSRRNEGKAAFDMWLGNKEKVATVISSAATGLPAVHVHYPLIDNDSSSISFVLANQLQQRPLAQPAKHESGHVGDYAWVIQKAEQPVFPEIGDFEKDQPFSVSLWTKLNASNMTGALVSRMNEADKYRGWDVWVENGRIGMHIINAYPENAIKVVSEAPVAADKWHHVAITYDGSSSADGIQLYIDGASVKLKKPNNNLNQTIRTNVPFRIGARHSSAAFENGFLQDVKIFSAVLSAADSKRLFGESRTSYLLTKNIEKRSPAENDEIYNWYLNSQDESFQGFVANLAQLEKERQEIEGRGTIAHIMAEKAEPPKAFVLFRGDYDKRRDEVTPKTPSILPPLADDLPKSRLGLAQWLVSGSHPLTARVTVNRFWQELFGQGLVATSGDFGIAGQTPTHPDLLDYLAVSFVEDNWNVKNFYRRVVTSATYRQSAATTPEKLASDASNKLFSRGPRFRMDAEMVRDYALATSGLLVKRVGGPSVRPYQPPGVWEAVAMPGSDTRDYREDNGEGLYRRSMYTFWKRSAPPASMDIFNAPSREVCTVKRERTNTPLQALVTLNDPQFVEAARNLSQQLLLKQDQDEMQRIQHLATTILSRPLRGDEVAVVTNSLGELRQYYNANPKDAESLLSVGKAPFAKEINASELAAWTMLTNQLLNLDEVLCK